LFINNREEDLKLFIILVFKIFKYVFRFLDSVLVPPMTLFITRRKDPGSLR